MRIIFVTLFFPPARTAGTENYTLTVARGLAARGHKVHVVCADGWSAGARYWNGLKEDTYCGIPVTRVALNWTKAADPNLVLYDSPVVERWFDRVISNMRPDLVHVTSAHTLGVGVLRAAYRAGVPQVLTLTDFWFLCPRSTLLTTDGRLCDGKGPSAECLSCLLAGSGLERRLSLVLSKSVRARFWRAVSTLPALSRLRGARGMALDIARRRTTAREVLMLPDAILSPSQFVQGTFASSGVCNRVRVLPHGHDLTWVRSMPRKIPSPVLRVAYMGQLIPIKGVHVVVDGFRRASLGSAASLDIWGDPAIDRQYAASLRALIGSSSNMRLRGAFGRGRLAEVLGQTDILVVASSWFENAPLVIQEAFAAKVPVIATNLGGMAEAVTHEVNGLLFERNDSDDLARQLRRLVDEPGLLSRLVTGIPEVRTTAQELDELEALYLGLAADNAAGSRLGAQIHQITSGSSGGS